MPKIIKTKSADAIYADQSSKAQKLIENKNTFFGSYTYLADNEEIYIVMGDSEIKEWVAYKCIAPEVKNKTNFYDMLAKCKPTGEVSKTCKTKKELTNAIEMNSADWKEWETTPKIFKHISKSSNSSSAGIPFWVWIVVGVVIVFVIASL
tara:strand:- start:12 stop:461 length:450 start_codon:yes stop_codon:yes gene_type:complete